MAELGAGQHSTRPEGLGWGRALFRKGSLSLPPEFLSKRFYLLGTQFLRTTFLWGTVSFVWFEEECTYHVSWSNTESVWDYTHKVFNLVCGTWWAFRKGSHVIILLGEEGGWWNTLRLRRHFKVKISITQFHLMWTGGQGGVRLWHVSCAKGAWTFFYCLVSPNQNDPIQDGFLGPRPSIQPTLTQLQEMRGVGMEPTVRIP